nr:J209 [uncultured bacterium]
MLSREDNDLLTNTDKGTPMGELFRRYWIPVALSDELPGPDCVPVKLRILGEDLIAYRDTDGQVGLVDAYCPHRGAPMFFARNEEAGLRCVYHGWKFDVTGQCTDMPNTPEGDTFRNKIQITAYPCFEAAGIVFSFMGPKNKQPPKPQFDFADLPPTHYYVTKFQLECNWLQATEGDFDPSHGNFLHSTLDNNRGNPGFAIFNNRTNPNGQGNQNFLDKPIPEDEPFPFAVGTRRIKAGNFNTPEFVSLEDVNGAMYSHQKFTRPDGEEIVSLSLRFLMPSFCPPGITRQNHYAQNVRIPVDNTHMMFFRLRWSLEPMTRDDLVMYKQGGYVYPEMIPGTFKTKANVWNDYEVDRLGQKTFLYSGIKTFPLQDIAMMENQWGPLADRTKEHLVAMDFHMIYLRRKLLRTAKALRDGIEPSEPWQPETYAYHSASVVIENGDYNAALEKAKERAKTSLLPADRLAATIRA